MSTLQQLFRAVVRGTMPIKPKDADRLYGISEDKQQPKPKSKKGK